MRTIWKYPISKDRSQPDGLFEIDLPPGAVAIRLDGVATVFSGNDWFMWVDVPDASIARKERRTFQLVPTGCAIRPPTARYIDSATVDGVVAHLFQL